ncbi:MAG: tyrosine-protein phosphatase [Novosphingobium sp.]|jgi:protein tyrosine/serine phosphatase|nr:tyrosine-protein phosphatase [Novosphingobium sp.]
MSANRVLVLEGVHNFRDYGGYPVAGGGRLRRGVLWRSGQHHGATESDLARIAALELAAVFDLRSGKERASHPCRRPEGFVAAVHIAEDPPQRAVRHSAPHVAAAQVPRRRDAVSTREGMCKNYGAIAFRPELIAMMRRYLAELAEGKGASLINCMAGKDRTGIAVAALHLAAGVHRDDIVEDYLLTNTAGNVEARIAAGMATITEVTGQLDPEVLRVLMGVEAEYLESAFRMMAEKHGSTDGYLREVLGLDDAMRERLRAVLVEG